MGSRSYDGLTDVRMKGELAAQSQWAMGYKIVITRGFSLLSVITWPLLASALYYIQATILDSGL